MNGDPWHNIGMIYKSIFHDFGEIELWLTKYEIRMRGGYKDWHDIDMCGVNA